ncbi:PIG-L deacetylase family protein [Phytomonospora endophytica]|uniref:LmbE family N-acetylglucosaminyl deacetylase n=1 Tax=Phytomonospora endophytica TaxID=714109 RepID=A0A841FXE1_9ACTN|nr:PIG-L family deacetylase [Phytomonospora endophytica]MBB6038202.1 LmbE family N-acetylglucosaminyl deacetylase [Phytomonospora endophytica]GIG67338.1 hypothetical protein Pen01_36330 [Phytomonospora endophytica]
MTNFELPIPDGTGIYTFPDDLLTAHDAWQKQLAQTPKEPLILRAPHDGTEYLIAERSPTGRPVIVIEPHHDDVTLSAAGLFLKAPRPLTVVTVFTKSSSVHPALEEIYPTIEVVSELRALEATQAFRPLAALHIQLDHKDADPPYRPYTPAALEAVLADLERIVAEHPDAELLAPAGVTRHPDHLLVHDAARRLGCRWFFEDLAYWPTYALSTDDQHLFQLRAGSQLVPELADITEVLLDKQTLLHLHASQMHPARARYRTARHAWTTGHALGPGRFAERYFRTKEAA